MKPVDHDSQEFSLHFYPNDPEKLVYIYTTIPAEMNRMDTLCEKYPNSYKMVLNDGYGKKYTMPKKYLKFRSEPSEAMKEKGRNLALKSRNDTPKNT